MSIYSDIEPVRKQLEKVERGSPEWHKLQKRLDRLDEENEDRWEERRIDGLTP